MAELTNSDRTSPTALKLKQIYLERLDMLRRQNDSERLNAEQTALQRGRILEVKRLLSDLEQKKAQTPQVTDTD